MPDKNQPLGGNEMPRFGGPATMMRLPAATNPEGLDACFIGVPLDIGTSHRPGARFGPRQIRAESCLIRPYNMATGAAPFDTLQVATWVTWPSTPSIYPSRLTSSSGTTAQWSTAAAFRSPWVVTTPSCCPYCARWRPSMARWRSSTWTPTPTSTPTCSASRWRHGTPFRRAVEEGLLQGNKVWQIGLRGSGYSAEDFDWPRQQGFTIVPAHEVWWQSLAPLMTRIHQAIGPCTPTYLSFDIDGIDPAYAGGTGTPEIGGLNVPQALEIVRGCRGLNLVGCDLVEVSPAYDPSGNTALLGANLLYEMLCVLPGVKYR